MGFGIGVFLGQEFLEQGRHARKEVGLFFECSFLFTTWGAQFLAHVVTILTIILVS